jgi:hypothetical protein
VVNVLDLQASVERYYDPYSGRFLSEDPLGRRADINLYRYVKNNPLITRDPFGLYGTRDCSYYDQTCQANGGRYECKAAPWLCNKFPKEDDTSNCMRQCLQEKHKKRMQNPNQCHPDNAIDVGDNAADHITCAVGCFRNPENPYQNDGPNLPDGSPVL